ncbi:MAG TPA: tetratricopeptide repeat protein [Caldimonas sp.]|jgi:predicted ATPase/class 3 adenylate cyclase|nr:tetratricopeptide repeat protein [Caldimonas sp.]HEX2542448.1 tetratricopeptide repeat protein [Caldimonas sp.]
MSAIKALLLTDVVDSTRLSEMLGDSAMAEVWAAHDRVARALLPPWRGREIDKTDGMLLLFDSCADAVGYALAYHRALATLPMQLKARAGLHVGPVILRHNAPDDIARGAKPLEVEGLAKPIAARVMALARGGQTLLSAAARDDLGKCTHKLVSHGHWRLKGVTDPVELFEIGDADTEFAQPADGEKAHRVAWMGEWWLPVNEIPNNLPQPATSFIGRERELAEVRNLLGTSRLLTLLGMGGLGKTRLSLQVAAEQMHQFPDGVWFLDLAPISDPALVVGEAAKVLGVREEPDRPLLQTLCAHLKSRRALLILDNCEHLVKASAQLASAILKVAPQVRLLASSREALRAPGEQCYPVLPLPVPSRGDSMEALLRSTAVRLFVDRAQLHKPGFSLGEREAPAVAELVARLEGIPLALELAAARIRALSVADINARLKDRYKLLTGGSRILQERQQTLRALVDWSYELLGPQEQTVLDRLGVFVGGFDLAAAEAVCGGEPIAGEDVLDLLASLVEKSLVMIEERDDGARYLMLETIREYVREKLAQRDDAAATAARHCEHYFAMAKAANKGLKGPQQADWLWKVEVELDNIRSAIALSLAGGVDPFIAVKFAVAMQGFWILRGYSSEGRKLVQAALAVPAIQASPIAQAYALYVGAALAESQSDHAEARKMLETCLELRRALGHEVDIAATLSTLSMARLLGGDPAEAAAGENEALQIFRRHGDRYGEAICLLHLGQVCLFQGEDEEARAHLEQCLAVAREIRHQEVEGECELVLGEVALEMADRPQACLRIKRSLTVCREAGDKRGEANALRWLARVELDSGDLPSTRSRLADALRAFRAFEMREELLGGLEDCAELAEAEGYAEVAAGLAAWVARSRERLGLKRSPRGELRWQALVGKLRRSLSDATFERVWDEARDWQLDEAMGQALSPQAERVTA